jgi:hypothetical protein
MLGLLTFVLVVVGEPAPAAAAAEAPATPWVVRQLTQAPDNRQRWAFAYPYITWIVPTPGQPSKLYLCDVRSGETKLIADEMEGHARSNGKYVTYTTNAAWLLYDIASGDVTKIKDNPAGLTYVPNIAGDVVTFRGQGGYVYSIAEKKLTQVSQTAFINSELVTDGRTVVWTEETEARQHQLMAFDVATATTVQLAVDRAWAFNYPQVSGDHLVWWRMGENQTGSEGVFLYNLKTGQAARVSHEKGELMFPPQFDGASIVWLGTADGPRGYNGPVYAFHYDIKSGKTNKLSQDGWITTAAPPRVGGGVVAWNAAANKAEEPSLFIRDGKAVYRLPGASVVGIDGGVIALFRSTSHGRGQALDIQMFVAERTPEAKKKPIAKPTTKKSVKPKAAGKKALEQKGGTKRGKITVGKQ